MAVSFYFKLNQVNLVYIWQVNKMETINIHEAKTQLSRLVEKAAKGEPFVIAKAGKPMVKVVALDSPDADQRKRLGFLADQIKVPDDFDSMGIEEIQTMFQGDS